MDEVVCRLHKRWISAVSLVTKFFALVVLGYSTLILLLMLLLVVLLDITTTKKCQTNGYILQLEICTFSMRRNISVPDLSIVIFLHWTADTQIIPACNVSLCVRLTYFLKSVGLLKGKRYPYSIAPYIGYKRCIKPKLSEIATNYVRAVQWLN